MDIKFKSRWMSLSTALMLTFFLVGCGSGANLDLGSEFGGGSVDSASSSIDSSASEEEAVVAQVEVIRSYRGAGSE